MVKEYKEYTRYFIVFIGNENNYGLFWEGAETEDFPIGRKKIDIRAQSHV